jgi:hypothetical protein
MSSDTKIDNLAQQPSDKPIAEKQLRVLICGSRDWQDKRRIGRYIDSVLAAEQLAPENLTVIHGACKGADHHAGMEAKGRGCQVLEFPANWAKFGLSAGPKRNQQMLTEGKPDRVVAFHADWENSKGTRDMINRTKFHGVPFEIIKE